MRLVRYQSCSIRKLRRAAQVRPAFSRKTGKTETWMVGPRTVPARSLSGKTRRAQPVISSSHSTPPAGHAGKTALGKAPKVGELGGGGCTPGVDDYSGQFSISSPAITMPGAAAGDREAQLRTLRGHRDRRSTAARSRSVSTTARTNSCRLVDYVFNGPKTSLQPASARGQQHQSKSQAKQPGPARTLARLPAALRDRGAQRSSTFRR